VPRRHRRHLRRSLPNYVAAPDSVRGPSRLPSARGPSRLPSARTIGLSVGAGRLAIGAIFLLAPVPSVRLLGLDTATAARITWLARMTAGRDGVLGAGTLMSAARRDGAGAWLLAGAVSDAVDAAVLVAALREGKVRGWRAQFVTAGAIAAAVVATGAAVNVGRCR
jgi:hypothetical protein